MAYEIGYRRPPKSGQFTKGKTGNAKGRPKGSSNFLTILESELGQNVIVNENGKKKTVTRMQAMVKRIVAGALQGDQKALLTLVEILRRTGRFEGPVAQDFLPHNYEALLDSFVQQRRQLPVRSESATRKKESS